MKKVKLYTEKEFGQLMSDYLEVEEIVFVALMNKRISIDEVPQRLRILMRGSAETYKRGNSRRSCLNIKTRLLLIGECVHMLRRKRKGIMLYTYTDNETEDALMLLKARLDITQQLNNYIQSSLLDPRFVVIKPFNPTCI